MIPRRASRLENGVIRSFVKTPSFFSSVHAIPIRSGCRTISFLDVTSSEAGFKRSDIGSKPLDQDSIVARLGGELEPDDDSMNAAKEAELLAMQHIFGLKDASDESLKTKPKDLERLQRLKAAEPVFVCIDLEAFEFAQDKITEVGVSMLDSRHVIGTDPGPDGMQWLSKISTRHMIIAEHKRLVNKRFVHGCPDKFNFGKSEIVSLNRVHATLTHLFDNPSPGSVLASDRGPRKLILVGHGLSNDTAYLNKLKFSPHAKGNIIQDVDTQQFVGTKKQTVSLSRLMAGLGVDPENLHNAGNDAAYTLQALLLMTVQHTNNPGAYIKAVAEAKGKVDPAKQRYKDHKAKIREQNAKAARAKLEKPIVESIFAEPLRQYEDNLASREAIKAYNAAGAQQQPEGSPAAWEMKQSRSLRDVPVSTVSELEGLVQNGELDRRQDMVTAELSEYNKQTYRRPSLADQPERVTQDLNSVSKKRKSPDAEPTRGAWEEDDEFSISPSFHSEPYRSQTLDRDDDDGGVSITNTQPYSNFATRTTAEPLTTQETYPKVRISRSISKIPPYARRSFMKEQHEYRAGPHNQPPNLGATIHESDQSLVRRVIMKEYQGSDQSLVRRVIMRHDEKWDDKSSE